jgi:predicted DNA-binding transcriptional regulator AlpA
MQQASLAAPETATLEDEGFILLTELRPIVPLHPQHIRKLVRRREFPAPVRIGGRTAFARRAIRDWCRRQTEAQPI